MCWDAAARRGSGRTWRKAGKTRREDSRESPNQTSDDSLIHLSLALGILKVATEPLNGTLFSD